MVMEIKKRIVYILIAVTVILIVLNAVLGSIENNPVEVSSKKDYLTVTKIENTFEKILSDYGIQTNWITKVKLKKNKYDSLKYKYNIEVPTAVPIPMIIKEMSLKLKNKNASISSKEEYINGASELEIKSGGFKKLIAKLEYNHSLKRVHSSIAFIITDLDDLDENELNTLLKNSFRFGALLPLRSSSIKIAEKILSYKRNYFINLDDDADNINFELNEDLNVKQLKHNIKSIVSSFNTPLVYFISKKRTGFSNGFISFLQEEFKKRNRKVLRLKSYIKLKGENKEDLNSLLEFHLNKLQPGKSKLFIISINDWWDIQKTLTSYTKKGNKIVLPASLLY